MNVSSVAASVADPESKILKMSTTQHDDFQLLAVFWPLLNDAKGTSMGVPEAKLIKESGLEVQSAMQYLGRLERENLITSRITQVGTAGPYERYYRLILRHVRFEIFFENSPPRG